MQREQEIAVLRACRSLCRKLGLGPVLPQVIGRFSNLAVVLTPLPIVARVTTGTSVLRGTQAHAQREVALAAFLAGRQAPLVAPCEPPLAGPHEVDGLVISLWQQVEVLPVAPDAAQAGLRLLQCHTALRDFECDAPLLGAFDEIDQLLALPQVLHQVSSADRSLVTVHARACREALQAFGAPIQVVHGDAHLNNVLDTHQGVLWSDWEDAIKAPIEWDLACLVAGARVLGRQREWSEMALRAYRDEAPRALGRWVDDALLDVCVHARTVFVVAWLWVLAGDDPARQQRLSARLEWLRQQTLPG
jgi:hypothetical protein